MLKVLTLKVTFKMTEMLTKLCDATSGSNPMLAGMTLLQCKRGNSCKQEVLCRQDRLISFQSEASTQAGMVQVLQRVTASLTESSSGHMSVTSWDVVINIQSSKSWDQPTLDADSRMSTCSFSSDNLWRLNDTEWSDFRKQTSVSGLWAWKRACILCF